MPATIHVFTFKAGLLARVAHDLRLTAQRHELTLKAGHVAGHCAADSLKVDGVMTPHGLDSSVLSDKDQRQILETVRVEILQSERYPRIEIEGEVTARSDTSLEFRGKLRLKGHERPLNVELRQVGGSLQATFELKPSEFGIPPYKALAGAIKLEDRVKVSVDIPLQSKSPRSLLESAEPLQL